MSNRSLRVTLAALIVVAPTILRAQEDDIEFAKARKEFVAGQPRAAANTLLASSLGVRQQVGRCRDVAIGTELLEAESTLDKLAGALRAGSVKEVKALDETLTRIDHALARHYVLLVKATLARPRADNIPVAADDLERAALHFERSVTLAGGKLGADQTAAIAEARKLSAEIRASNAMPVGTSAVVASMEKLLEPPVGAK